MSSFSYSIDQIDKIFESASRRGQIRMDWLKLNKHDVDVVYKELAEKRKALKRKLKEERGKNERREDVISDLEEQLEKNIEEKGYVEKEIKEEVLHDILKRDFEIDVKQKWHEDSGKYIYVTGKDRDSFFACKIINDELQKTYKIDQPNRNVILNNLKLLLTDRVDKIIIRADIKSFFETIPRDRLMANLEQDGIINRHSIKIMKRMFYDLDQKYGFCNGVPRGISFSPGLADIYLRDIDKQINQLDGVYLYQRYVDDIIIIASSSEEYPTAKSLFAKVDEIFSKGEMTLHPEGDSDKYMAENIQYGNAKKISFDYLGYHIILNTENGNVKFRLTKRRIDKYVTQIDKVISYYKHVATNNPRKADKKENRVIRHCQPLYRFNKLLAYLTCNYRLGGAKSNVLSGIYFKHSMLTDTLQLRELDKWLYDKFDAEITQNLFADKFHDNEFVCKLRKKIHDEYSFEAGFNERKMCHLTSADFRTIKRILQYEEAKN